MSSKVFVKSVQFEGFYEIPEFSRYVINPQGVVISKYTGKVKTFYRRKNGYYAATIIPDSGRTTSVGRYRLLALAFLERPDITGRLVVNHKNGIKTDDELDNLEWTNDKGNLEHAGLNGLTSKCTPVSVRDVYTGSVVSFPSLADCANSLGLSKDAVKYRLSKGERRVFPEGKQYRKFGTLTDWHVPSNIESCLLVNSTNKSVQVRFLQTGEIITFAKQRELASYLNVSESTLSVWLSKDGLPILPGLIQVRYYTTLPWREVSDPYLELELNGMRGMYDGRVVVVSTMCGNRMFFTSLAECADKLHLNITALHYRLGLKNPNKFFRDGNNYLYYTDYIRIQSKYAVTRN